MKRRYRSVWCFHHWGGLMRPGWEGWVRFILKSGPHIYKELFEGSDLDLEIRRVLVQKAVTWFYWLSLNRVTLRLLTLVAALISRSMKLLKTSCDLTLLIKRGDSYRWTKKNVCNYENNKTNKWNKNNFNLLNWNQTLNPLTASYLFFFFHFIFVCLFQAPV